MVKIFCKLCQLPVEVSSWQDHITTERHTGNLPSNIIVNCVIGKDKIKSVHEYFAKFGTITRKEVIEIVGKNIKIQYCFEDASVYSTITQKQHTLFGQNLEIEFLKSSNKSAANLVDKKARDSCSVLKKDICSSISENFTFTKQISILQDKFKSNNLDRKTLDAIQKNLTTILKSKFPSCKVSFYGSKDTGLNIDNSKLGVFVDIVKEKNLNENQTLQVIQTLIANSKVFDNVLIFADEEFPIVKFKHIATETMCYLNIRSKLIVKRSELLKYYMSLNEKVSQFLITIKFWAKCHNKFVEGSPNYGLHILAIFYLQQDPYNLPSVAQLQTNIKPDLVNEWNCALNPLPFSSPTLNKATILELLTGFFKFYENFDFFSFVISPYCGHPIEKTRFMPPYWLPSCFNFSTQQQTMPLNCGLAVQDPFEHVKNIFGGVPVASGNQFSYLCRCSLQIIASGESYLLTKLLEPISSDEKQTFVIEKPEKLDENNWKTFVAKLTEDIFTKIFCSQMTKTSSRFSKINYKFSCFNDIWTNRLQILKELESDSIFCTEFDKEVAVSSRLNKDPRPKPLWKVMVVLMFQSNRVQFQIKSILKDNKKSTICHFVRVKLEKFLKEMKNEDISSEDFTILTQSMGVTPLLWQQIEILQKMWERNKIKIEKECKMIIDDLNSALFSQFSNRVYFFELSKISLNFPNNVFSIFVHNSGQKATSESITLDTIRILLGKSQSITKVSSFFGTGVIKFTHKNKNPCVLTLRSQKLITRSTELIRYYLSLDQRFEPLIFIVNLWLNYYKLTEIDTYTLHLMVLFYLQRTYDVPSISHLQKNASPVMIDGWKCGIVATKFTNPKLKNSTFFDLVRGFFTFYSKFDYNHYLISPFSGLAIEKTKFLKPCDLPEIFKDYIENANDIRLNMGLCVQDILEHSRNVMTIQPLQFFSKFTSCCRQALQAIEQEGENYFCDLFSKGVPDQMYEYEIEKPEGVDEEEWKGVMINLSLTIMTEVLSFKCSDTLQEGKYDCESLYDVLSNRLQCLKKHSNDGSSDFTKEVAATESVGKMCPRKSVVYMEINFKASPFRMLISFSPAADDFDFDFTDFFYSRLMKYSSLIDSTLRSNDAISDIDSGPFSSPQDHNFSPDREEKSKRRRKGSESKNVYSDFSDDFSDVELVDDSDLVGARKQREEKTKRGRSVFTERRLARKYPRRRFLSRSRSKSKSRSRVGGHYRRSLSRNRHRRSRSRTRFRRSISHSRRAKSRSHSRPRDRNARKDSEEKMKNRRKHSRSRSRDRRRKRHSSASRDSADSRHTKKSVKELKKKLSFFEEIRKRLNDSGVSLKSTEPVVSSVAAIPLPVPPSNPNNAVVPTYDQSFFVGSRTTTSKVNEEYILKHFEEKKISFYDYLTLLQPTNEAKLMTAEHLRMKAKVLSQCQDMIDILNNNKVCRLTAVPIAESSTKSETKYKSPLTKTMLKFKFTNPMKNQSEIDPFSQVLHTIFEKLGLFQKERDVWKLVDSVAEAWICGTKTKQEVEARIFQISLLSPLASNGCKKKVTVGTQCEKNVSLGVQIDWKKAPH